jgi:photosystem II stability/assembly factor-like uncharacterized protein
VNASPPLSSRRGFLTALFPDPRKSSSGTGLTTVAELRQQTDAVLWAVAGDAPDNIFVAGDDGVVFHFDGQHWQAEDLGSKLNVHSLCISGERVFSVGWLGRICVREDGRWRPLQGGQNEAGAVNQPLFEIDAAPDGTLWAVGDQGRITRFDGEQWLEQDSPGTANLRAVLPMADGRVLVAGLGGTALELCDGQWRTIETNTGCPIVSMTCLNEDTVIAVGGEYCTQTQAFIGRIFLYSDGQWSAAEVDYPLPRLRRVRREGNNILITGDSGTAFRWTEQGASLLPTRLRYDLHDVISFATGDALICGDCGTVLQESPHTEDSEPAVEDNRGSWQTVSHSETNKTLRTLWPVADNHLIAAGDSGTVLHYRDGQVTLQQIPGKPRIHALWGSSPKNIYAVCDAATILHFDGQQWEVAHQGGVDTALLAITGFGPHDIFAVGDNGYALRYDGLMWRQIETGIKQELYGLWGQDSQHLLAVGGGGVILRFNGERWKSFGAGTDQDLYGVYGTSLNKLFIAGLAGTLIRFEDNSWHREFTGVRSDLHDVTASDGAYYAVGSNGTILRNDDGIWEIEHSTCSNTLQAIAATDKAIYAVGSGGVVLTRQG